MRHEHVWSRAAARAVVLACLAAAPLGAFAANLQSELIGVWAMPAQRGPNANPQLKLPPVSPPPLNEEYRRIYDAKQKLRQEADARGEPIIDDRTLCFPDGVPKMLASSFPIAITMGRGSLTLITEFNTQVRHILLDGAQHPAPDELDPTFFGHSIGTWEKDALVVDTIGLRGSTVLFQEVPHSEQLRVVERFRLRTPTLLEVEITMIDPVVFTRPWTVVRLFERSPEPSLQEFVCVENNRHSISSSGTIQLESAAGAQ